MEPVIYNTRQRVAYPRLSWLKIQKEKRFSIYSGSRMQLCPAISEGNEWNAGILVDAQTIAAGRVIPRDSSA